MKFYEISGELTDTPDDYNMSDHDIEIDIFRSTIQKLTFTNCISQSVLCELACIYDYYSVEKEYPTQDLSYIEKNKYERRFWRLLQRLCVEKISDSSNEKLFEPPKIYDKYLLDSQIRLYNNLSKKVNYEPIEKIMSISRIKNIVTLTGENPDYEDIARVFPYYPEEKRDGVNFLECILLLALRVTLRSGSLFMLSKEEITDNNKYTARKNRDKVIKKMHSTILFELFSHAFYDIFELTVNKRHQKIAEESIRRVWLPENLKDRKDAFSAFERYKARFKGNLQFDCREYRLNHMMIDDKIVSDNYAYKLVKDFNEIDLISTDLLPMSFHFLTENRTEYFDFTDDNTNKRAINYANIIREYINLAIEEATDILNKMCEEILEFNEG